MKNFLIFFSLVAFNCHSSDFVELFTDKDSCSIKEVGGMGESDAVHFKGRNWKYGSQSGCNVSVPKKEFEERFSTCFLSGMHFSQPGMCTFSGRGGDVYAFEFDDKESLFCIFTCMKL